MSHVTDSVVCGGDGEESRKLSHVNCFYRWGNISHVGCMQLHFLSLC
jgi:hypothetical protein